VLSNPDNYHVYAQTSTPTTASANNSDSNIPSATGSSAAAAAAAPPHHSLRNRQDFVALHMDIQIYEMDENTHIVDFKCSGYETAERRLLEEKEVSSPFPFLDMVARLIMQLAETD
jgi:hypothetical protein